MANRASKTSADAKLVEKADKKRQLERHALEFIRKRYPQLDILASLQSTNQAQADALTAWRAWLASVDAELKLRIQQVNAADEQDPSTWRPIKLDREALRTSDPKLKYRAWVMLT